jgi:ABC-2 type transport system permease protein
MIVRIFSFFPLTAQLTLMVINSVGNLQNWEAILGLLILAVCSLTALAVATHTFRYGTLEYNRKLSWKEIFSIRS